jgi:hypothetical protein
VRLAVVIPARNRAELTFAAVESALRTPDPRVVVVVADNSSEADESERIRAFCAERPGRVTYVRAPEPLSMTDNWEYAWQRTRELVDPTHVTYLTNRMAFVPGALDGVLPIVERHPEQMLVMCFDTVLDHLEPMTLDRRLVTDQLLEIDPRRAIEVSSRFILFAIHLPLVCDTIVPAATMAAVEERFGAVFRPRIAPDYGFAFRSLTVSGPYLLLDRVCVVQYGVAHSTGFAHLWGRPTEASLDFERRVPRPMFGSTPVPALRTVVNTMWEEYCASRDEPGGEAFPPCHLRSYLAENAIATSWILDERLRADNEELLRRSGWTRRARAAHALREAPARARHRGHEEHERVTVADREAALALAAARPRPPAPASPWLEPVRRGGAILRRLPAGAGPPTS